MTLPRRLTVLASLSLGFLACALLACSSVRPAPPTLPASAAGTEVVLVQFNDVYEIGTIEAGERGGLARVATLDERLRAANPHTHLLLAGDFLSPSAMGTAKVGEEKLNGKQMIAVLNAMGLDLATFGNHEFDLGEPALLARLGESTFPWVSSNVASAAGNPYPNTVAEWIVTAEGPDGPVRVGVLGVTTQELAPEWVTVGDPLAELERAVQGLAGKVDAIVALTHLGWQEDVELAEAIPELDLVLGGHDHQNFQLHRGPDDTPITKADANVRSIVIHRLRFAPKTKRLSIDSEFVPITNQIPEQPAVKAEVERWQALAFAGFRAEGFEPTLVVTEVSESLDGREASVRNGATTLTRLIADSNLAATLGAELSIYNSGSIRIDDVIAPGPVTEYDVIRILPYGGAVLAVEMKGSLIAKTLDQGVANRGTGGFLQTSRVARDEAAKIWQVAGQPLDPERWYLVAMSDFLLTGRETGLGFLTTANPDLRLKATGPDVRHALMDELQHVYGGAD